MPCGRGTTRCWYRIGTLPIGPLDAEGMGVLLAGAVSDGLERRPEVGAGVTRAGGLAVGFATCIGGRVRVAVQPLAASRATRTRPRRCCTNGSLRDLAQVAASHRWLRRRGWLAPGALRLAAGPADVVAQVPEVLADLVPGVADIVLRVRAVDAADALLDVGLDIAVRAFDFVHRPISFHSLTEDGVLSVAVKFGLNHNHFSGGEGRRPRG